MAVGCLVLVPIAWASHLFTDVPDASPFHDDISAVKGAGITGGKTCEPPGTPPTYCPSESITREAMAAFLHRGLGRVGFSTGSVTSLPVLPAPYAELTSVTLSVGGLPGSTQLVLLEGAVTLKVTAAGSCPCAAIAIVYDDSNPGDVIAFANARVTAVAPSTVGNAGYVTTMFDTAVRGVPAGTTRTYKVGIRRTPVGSEAMSATGELTALTIPFTASGGNP